MRLLRVTTAVALCGQLLWAQSLRQNYPQMSWIDHSDAEIRLGYISHSFDQRNDTHGAAFAGHFHLATKSWRGLQGSVAIYGLTGLGAGSDEEFFGQKEDFVFVSQAALAWQGERTQIEVGRLIFDSPHADSDDIRMVPNYFEGVHARYRLGEGALHLGYLRRMAGWESGGHIERFKDFDEVLETQTHIDGVATIGYEEDGLSLWAYHMDDLANVVYAQKHFAVGGFDLELQADWAKGCGKKAQGQIDALTLGFLLQKSYEGLTLTLAYDKNFGDSGAMGSFGGGPFFTSMEELTIDGIEGDEQEAVSLGASYERGGLTVGIMGGRFMGADTTSDEIDLYASYSLGSFGIDTVFASIDNDQGEDFTIFRIIAKYGF